MGKTRVAFLVALVLFGATVAALPTLTQARSSSTPTAQPAAAPYCLGWRVRSWMNSDGMTATYRFSPVFRGGRWPPRPWTSASVWYNHTNSVYYYDQRGRHVDVLPFASWRITGLVLKVSSGEPVLGGKLYRCPNRRYR